MEAFTFKSFLSNLHDAGIFEGIFQALFQIINEEPTIHHKKKLLLQACLFYDGSIIELDQELIGEVLTEFKFMETELNQCLGFLQLLYKNNSTAFSQLRLSQIMELEQEMPLLSIQVFNFLKGFLSPYLKPFFTPSLTCLTPPIIQSIQENGGKAIFKDVPVEFLVDFVPILIHCFDPKHENFRVFTETMQLYFIKYEKRLIYFRFDYALKYMADLLKRRDQRWIGDLIKILDVFKTLIEEIILKKENYITQEVMEAAMNQDEVFLENVSNKKLIKDSQYNSMHFWTDAYFLNKQNGSLIEFIDNYELGEISKAFKELLQSGGIEQLLPVQELCFSYIRSRNTSVFSVVGIGNGKTILCNILAAYLAQIKKKYVIVLNKHECLSYRNGILFDQTFGKSLHLTVGFDGKQSSKVYDVTFMCESEVFKHIELSKKNLQDIVLVMDEADQILFQECSTKMNDKQLQLQKDRLVKFSQFLRIYAFSGTLTELEEECLNEMFDIDIAHFPKLSQLKPIPNNLILEAEFYHKQDWIKAVSVNAISKCKEVPVLILIQSLLEKEILKQLKDDSKDFINAQSLINKKPIDISNALKVMPFKDQVKGYSIYLVDEILCRGLDIKTTREIEEKGGLFVLIAKIPSNTKVFEQAKGRTQRLTNKGQHSIIIWNQTKKSFRQILQEGDDKSQFNIRKLHQILKSYNKEELPEHQHEQRVVVQNEEIKVEHQQPNEQISMLKSQIELEERQKEKFISLHIEANQVSSMQQEEVNEQQIEPEDLLQPVQFSISNHSQNNPCLLNHTMVENQVQIDKACKVQPNEQVSCMKKGRDLRQLRVRQAVNYKDAFIEDDQNFTKKQKFRTNKRRKTGTIVDFKQIQQSDSTIIELTEETTRAKKSQKVAIKQNSSRINKQLSSLKNLSEKEPLNDKIDPVFDSLGQIGNNQ